MVPSWPSLYNPGIEILHIEHHDPTHPKGAYLYHAKGNQPPIVLMSQRRKKKKKADALHNRHFPIHAVLDFNLLYPYLLVLRVVCLLELRISSITSPPNLSNLPRFNISAFNLCFKYTDAIDPTPKASKTKRTTIKSGICCHSLDDLPHPGRGWCCRGFGHIRLRRSRLVQVS